MESENQVRTVLRAVAILEQFTLARPELSLYEISAGAGLSKTTTHRLLGTLENAQMIARDKKTGQYRLGLKVFSMGSVVSGAMALLKQADPLLETLADETEESSFLVIPDENEALCLRRFNGRQPARVLPMEAGGRAPFNCASAPRVLLAHLPEPSWERIVTSFVRPMTRYSLISRDDLKRDRDEIRERGYCLAWEDALLGACGVGAPVYDASGTVIAAIGMWGMIQELSSERLPGLIRRTLETGDELSRRLGHTS